MVDHTLSHGSRIFVLVYHAHSNVAHFEAKMALVECPFSVFQSFELQTVRPAPRTLVIPPSHADHHQSFDTI